MESSFPKHSQDFFSEGMELNPFQRAWVEINPLAIEANARTIREQLADRCELMAVVKADGYGHGAEVVSKAALKGGANSLGVATLQEGIALRRYGLDTSILILGNITSPEELKACLHWRLIPTLSSLKEAKLCNNLANDSGRQFQVQLKVDTGMTRLGCDFNEANQLADEINKYNDLDLTGIYSHLASADTDNQYGIETVTYQQKQKFESVLRCLSIKRNGFCRHLANSAGTLSNQSLHYDMVRVGLALYGYNPLRRRDSSFELKPALSVKARVTLIREVPAGIGVSYGHKFITSRTTRLAVIAIGYADGIPRSLSGKISALFKGKFLPQVGAITMDQLIIDATDHLDLKVGSIVTLLGQNDNQAISPFDWSDFCFSIPWEILCGFKHRLPRVLI